MGYNAGIIMKYLLVALSVFFLSFNITVASGKELTTSNPNSGVIVTEENGVKYLSTTVTADTPIISATDSSSLYSASNSARSSIGFPRINIQPPEGFFTDLPQLFNKLINVVLVLSTLLTLAYLIWGAFQWITSGGDKGKTEKARNALVAAVIGLIIVASSYAILLLVLNFLGYQSLNEVLEQADITRVDRE